MKKFIYSALAAIGLLLSPSCSDENEVLNSSGNEALVSFNVNLADGISTKAEEIGNGKTATKLQVDVYEISGENYIKLENLTKYANFDTEKKATVDMTLVKGKEYGFVFWAKSPNASIYSVGNQEISVSYNNPECNKEDYDAFLATDQFVAKQSFNREVILRRPLAQLNYLVSESDLLAAERQGMSLTDLQTSIKISDAARTLHPFTNTVSGGGAVTFTPTRLQDLSSGNTSKQGLELPKIDGTPGTEPYYYLATTYFLVKAGDNTKDSGKNTQALVDTKMTIGGLQAGDYALSVQNVPVQWNHRTNIYGNLLTASGQFVVKINPLFEEEEDINLPNVETVSSVEEIQTALANGSNTIKAAADFTIPENRIIPVPENSAQNNTEEISFDFSAITNSSTLTFQKTGGTGEVTAKNVSIIANGDVVIDLPDASVTLNGAYYNQVTATTAPNSLYIERGVTVDKLIANNGNVHIKGTIGEFERGTNYNDHIYYYISTADQLREFAGVVNGTVTGGFLQSIYSENPIIKLDEDIDLRNVEWTPIGKNADDAAHNFQGTFDGQGHTIRNLNVNQGEGYHAAGLFGALNGTAKNFTIEGAEITNFSTGDQTTNGTAVVAGSIYPSGAIEGVTVKNATVNGNRYVSGIAGYTQNATIKDCKVESSTITSTPDDLTGSYNNGDKAGGIAGAFWNSTINNCSAKNVKIKGYRDLGGIAGFANNKDNVTDCSVSNVTLIQDNTNAYKEDAQTTVGAIIGRGPIFIDGNYASAVTKIAYIGHTYTVTTNEGEKTVTAQDQIEAALSYGASEIILTEDVELTKELAFATDQNTTIDLNQKTLDADDNTINSTAGKFIFKNGFMKMNRPSLANYTIGIASNGKMEFDGIEFTSNASIFFIQQQGHLTVTNSILSAGSYAISTNASNPNQNPTITLG